MRRSLRAWRRKVARAAREMAALGLVTGSSGNVSLRLGDLMLITPSGIPYGFLDPRQIAIVPVTPHPSPVIGVPSSEWRMHVAIYGAREDVRAIVHTHSPYATAASFGGRLSVVHDEGALIFGEEVPVSEHNPPGTWDLAHAVANALGEGKAVLVARHGAVTVGRTLGEALSLAEKLEEAARLFLLTRKVPSK